MNRIHPALRIMCRNLAFVVLSGLATNLSAEPRVLEVTGELTPRGLVSVSGLGFGATGPEIVLFDDFEGVLPGQPASTDSPMIGQWTKDSNAPEGFPLGRSGSISMLAYNGNRQRQRQLVLPSTQRNIFISYWVRLAPDSYFPGTKWTDGRKRNTFSEDSSWKFFWLMNSPDGFLPNDGLFDVCLPTHVGRGSFVLGGNSHHTLSDRWIGNSFWNWNDWMRMSFSISDPRRASTIEYGRSQIVSANGYWSRTHSVVASEELPLDKHVFDTINVPGWIRWDSGTDVVPLYDDIYIAVGVGAQARVEITDAEDYEDSRHIEILLVEDWAADSISARVPPSVTFDPTRTWYLHVVDATGAVSPKGFRVEPCLECPMPPDAGVE